MARTRFEKGENEKLGAAFAEIAVEHYTLPKYTSATHRLASSLNDLNEATRQRETGTETEELHDRRFISAGYESTGG